MSVYESAGENGQPRGAGLIAVKMEEYRWLEPVLVGQFELVEWTESVHLPHSRFVGLREDKRRRVFGESRAGGTATARLSRYPANTSKSCETISGNIGNYFARRFHARAKAECSTFG